MRGAVPYHGEKALGDEEEEAMEIKEEGRLWVEVRRAMGENHPEPIILEKYTVSILGKRATK